MTLSNQRATKLILKILKSLNPDSDQKIGAVVGTFSTTFTFCAVGRKEIPTG